MRRLNYLLLTLALAACSSKDDESDEGDVDEQSDVGDEADDGEVADEDEPDDEEDTGGEDDDTGDGPEPCLAQVEDMDPDPEDEPTDWFYRDGLEVEFEYLPEPTYEITLVDSAGEAVPFEVEWAEDAPDASIKADLTGNETYTLTATCGNEMASTFTTSAYGAPLESDISELYGKVFTLDLPTATFTDPPLIGAFLGEYLTSALLAGIADVNAEELTLLVAQGELDDDDVASQDMGLCPYDFPPADFSDAPFFAADTELLEIDFNTGSSSVLISLYDMHLEGTISPDASSMGGAWISGLLETSNLGPLIDLTGSGDGLGAEASAVCDVVGDLISVDCVECGGSDYCLYVEAHFDEAPVADVVLEPDPLGTCLAEDDEADTSGDEA